MLITYIAGITISLVFVTILWASEEHKPNLEGCLAVLVIGLAWPVLLALLMAGAIAWKIVEVCYGD
jgi:hypothetical protein